METVPATSATGASSKIRLNELLKLFVL